MRPLSVSVDSAGRVVLPKSLRDILHLRAGSELHIAIADGNLVLTRLKPEVALIKEDGLWVHQGTSRQDLAGEVDALRDERLEALATRPR